MTELAAALVIFLGPQLPDGRREVLIELDAPWAWFDEDWCEEELEPEPQYPPYQGVILRAGGE